MTDDLRTRIAAVLSDHDPEGYALCEYHYDLADAVIGELGLKKEWLERPHSEERDIRWVTDWMPDE